MGNALSTVQRSLGPALIPAARPLNNLDIGEIQRCHSRWVKRRLRPGVDEEGFGRFAPTRRRPSSPTGPKPDFKGCVEAHLNALLS